MRASLLVVALTIGFASSAVAEEITVSVEGRAEVIAQRILLMALPHQRGFGEALGPSLNVDEFLATIRSADGTARPCAPVADNDPDLSEFGAPSWSAQMRRHSTVICREIAASSLARVERQLGAFRDRARIVFQPISSDPSELRRAAVRNALVLARSSADEIAQAAGLRLGEVSHIQGGMVSEDAANAGRALSPLVDQNAYQPTASAMASTSAFLTVTFFASR